ncbi:hypothetical protein [Hyperthermus butylicus]|uniref:Uncharacterized protein n=1 Tax=Hyperthermus butylicus (strain DSM 5456 / JCM 9403 / PLM1-5) TaxID=415426 RepID=A2BJ33_HYPBU|nr:hypothetical protein [Hyperthermus butylicus]ABM79994.1 hypothetical protein Hbut_0119 [Hyperthermus butylicus DSM 5456]
MPGSGFLVVLALLGAILGILYAYASRARSLERIPVYALLGAIALPAAYIVVELLLRLVVLILKAVLIAILALIFFALLKRLLE